MTKIAVRRSPRAGRPIMPVPSNAIAAPRSSLPSYSARPEIAPAIRPVSFSARRSSSEDTPPEAITGMSTASASAAVAATLGPASTAVTLDIGMDDRGDPGIGEILRQFGHRHLAFGFPAPRRDPTRAGIEPRPPRGPERPAPPARTKCGASTAAVPRIDTGHPAFQPAFQNAHVADAAAQLDRDRHRLQDLRHRARIHRMALDRAIEIDQMQPLAAGVLKRPGLAGGIGGIDRRGIHRAAHQPHAGAVLQIDGGIQDHRSSLRLRSVA